MIDDCDNTLTSGYSKVHGYSVADGVFAVVSVDSDGVWVYAFHGQSGFYLKRLGMSGRLAAGFPRPEAVGSPVWTNRGIVYESGDSMWLLHERTVRRIGPRLPHDERITPFGVLALFIHAGAREQEL